MPRSTSSCFVIISYTKTTLVAAIYCVAATSTSHSGWYCEASVNANEPRGKSAEIAKDVDYAQTADSGF